MIGSDAISVEHEDASVFEKPNRSAGPPVNANLLTRVRASCHNLL